MIRGLLSLIVVVVLLIAAAAFFFGYRWGDGQPGTGVDQPLGTTGTTATERARETGAEIGERVAVGANRVEDVAAAAVITARVKSKMALDEMVRALDIDVDTSGSVVTLSGRVSGEAARRRALQLARETEGVTAVVDRLSVAP